MILYSIHGIEILFLPIGFEIRDQIFVDAMMFLKVTTNNLQRAFQVHQTF
jgi:hypothetical protein